MDWPPQEAAFAVVAAAAAAVTELTAPTPLTNVLREMSVFFLTDRVFLLFVLLMV